VPTSTSTKVINIKILVNTDNCLEYTALLSKPILF
jgi:hypothetical protein